MTTPGVKIINAYNAKGLEFFRVIIPEFKEGKFPKHYDPSGDPEGIETLIMQFRSLAYVAMTRAQETLVITYAGKNRSRFIDEIDEDTYVIKGSSSKPQTKNINVTKINNVSFNKSTDIDISKTVSNSSSNSELSLLEFFQAKGFECVDKRPYGGCLWVIGNRNELVPVIREAKKIFGDLGNENFAEHGGRATKNQSAWYITADK